MEFISIEDKRKPEPNSTVVVKLGKGWRGKPIFAIADIGYEGKFEINEDGYDISFNDETGIHVSFDSPVVAWAQL